MLDARAPQNFSPTDNLTPANAAYVSPANAPVIPYTNGIITRNYIHYRLAPHLPPPLLGTTQTWTSGGLAQFQVTLDGGATWMGVLAQANTTVRLAHSAGTSPKPEPYVNSTIQTFDSELTQLDISGGNLPPGVRLRISPTRPSRGQATIQRTGGGFNLSSFIDIWTQISLDNGAHWYDAKTDQRVVLDSRGLENFSMSGNLTPANGAYVSAPAAPPIYYANGFITRDYLHYRLVFHPPLPPIGTNIVFTSPGLVDFCVSVDGGQTFTPVHANAMTQVRMTRASDVHFDTEMLRLDITGGNLPGGLMIRVSPTLPSRGQATVQPVDGGSRISSFFDLWTELSIDNGATWSPALNPQRVSLDARAPETKVTAPNLTPANSAYVSAQNAPSILYPGNIITRNYIHGRLLPHPLPPVLGSNQVYTTSGTAAFQVSLDGGNSFTDVVAQATTTVRLTHSMDEPEPDPYLPVQYYDTEMLQLDIFAGSLPQGVRLRVSPTLPSRGQATLQRVPPLTGSPKPPIWDAVSSFFDINTEISLDNGASWQPAKNAQRVSLDVRAPESSYASNLLPPAKASYNTLADSLPLRYPNGLITTRYRHRFLTNVITPPILGTTRTYSTLGSELLFDVSSDGGLSFQPVRALANMSLRISHSADAGGIEYYDTELLSLDFTGGNGLPSSVMFRESPTRQSLGQTTIMKVSGSSSYQLSSFIDIWTDLSLDSGQTWSSADHAARVAAVAPPLLSIRLEGNEAVVFWTPDATGQRLQSIQKLGDQWNDVPSASNPYRLNISNTQRNFFRLVDP